jgi:hypothetical protein
LPVPNALGFINCPRGYHPLDFSLFMGYFL